MIREAGRVVQVVYMSMLYLLDAFVAVRISPRCVEGPCRHCLSNILGNVQ